MANANETVGLVEARREEIIAACEQLSKTMHFKEITMKEIGRVTSFTRTSIYNYFRTREEIFLALLGREYAGWMEDLRGMTESRRTMTAEKLADVLARSVEKRPLMVKLLSMNVDDLEENCEESALASYYAVSAEAKSFIRDLLDQFVRHMDEEEKEGFVAAFFVFLGGLYPFTVCSKKQEAAQKQAGVSTEPLQVYELVFTVSKKLLERSFERMRKEN